MNDSKFFIFYDFDIKNNNNNFKMVDLKKKFIKNLNEYRSVFNFFLNYKKLKKSKNDKNIKIFNF